MKSLLGASVFVIAICCGCTAVNDSETDVVGTLDIVAEIPSAIDNAPATEFPDTNPDHNMDGLCSYSADRGLLVPEVLGGNVVLHVTNQSFDYEVVDIAIALDETDILQRDFDVCNQHYWVTSELSWPEGIHVLKMNSVDGNAHLEQTIEITGKKYILIDFWRHVGDAEGTFQVTIQDTPIGNV